MEEIDSNLRRLKLWATISTWTIALYIACAAAFAVSGLAILAAEAEPNETLLGTFGVTAIGIAIIFYISAFAIGMWIYRAHDNLGKLGHTDLEFTPGWSVGWFFVPFANLVMPFRAMRELWHHSCGSETPSTPILPLWWGCFLVGGITMTTASFIGKADDLSTMIPLMGIGSILRLSSAVILALIIRKITAAQASMEGIGSAFD